MAGRSWPEIPLTLRVATRGGAPAGPANHRLAGRGRRGRAGEAGRPGGGAPRRAPRRPRRPRLSLTGCLATRPGLGEGAERAGGRNGPAAASAAREWRTRGGGEARACARWAWARVSRAGAAERGQRHAGYPGQRIGRPRAAPPRTMVSGAAHRRRRRRPVFLSPPRPARWAGKGRAGAGAGAAGSTAGTRRFRPGRARAGLGRGR